MVDSELITRAALFVLFVGLGWWLARRLELPHNLLEWKWLVALFLFAGYFMVNGIVFATESWYTPYLSTAADGLFLGLLVSFFLRFVRGRVPGNASR